MEGNLYTTGELTALTTSDRRLKTNVRPLREPLRRLRALGGYSFFFYDTASSEIYTKDRIGLIAQQAQGNVALRMTKRRPDGFLSLNYLHPDYINLIGASVLQVDDELTRLRQRVAALEKELGIRH